MTEIKTNRIAIIVAGGTGKRMGSQIPKQFLPIAGQPVVFHTLKKFLDSNCKTILVLPKEHIPAFNGLAQKHGFDLKNTQICEGGKERYDSVKNGLEKIKPDFVGNVAVHDAVRPFISTQKIIELFELCEEKKAVVPVLKMKDSLRRLAEGNSLNVNRDEFVAVQTPQIFEISILRKAYSQPIPTTTTDDATLVELTGTSIHLAEGEHNNLKITTPEDLKLAEFLIQNH